MSDMRSSMHRFLRALPACIVLALGAGQLGCSEAPYAEHRPLSVRAASKELKDIGDGVVSGKLYGTAFTLAEARVRVETMPGRERVDLLLADAPIARCGLPIANDKRRVWLRWKGKPTLDGTPIRVELDDKNSPLSVHYEVPVKELWLSHGGGVALLSLRDRGFGDYTGQVWVCFDDKQESCLSGTFKATQCRSELDVDDSVWGAARLDDSYPTKRKE